MTAQKKESMSEDEDSEKMCDECFSAIDQGANHFSWCSRSLESLPSAKELIRRSLIDTTRIPIERQFPYCLGFEKKDVQNRVEWWGQPQIPYRIRGLLIWGADRTTLITRCKVANIECLAAGLAPIPALLFSAGLTFQDFLELQKPGRPGSLLMGEMIAIPRHFPFQEVIERTLSPADRITIEITGPFSQLVTWGHASG